MTIFYSFYHIGRVSEDDILKVGSVVSGVVEIVTPNAVIVYVNGKRHLKGTIYTEHLADHQGIGFFLFFCFLFLFSLQGVV